MTGLEQIIKQIEDDAAASAASIRRDAEEKAAQIASRAESAAALQKRQSILAAKQQIIRELMDKSLRAMDALAPVDYFANIQKLVHKYALAQNGEIFFSQRDLDRLPKGFEQQLAQAVPAGGSLKISREPRNMEGGFVLVYGGVEQNCSFAALFDAARDSLQDKLHALLFAGGY